MSTPPMTAQHLHRLVDPIITTRGYDVDDLTISPAAGGGTAATIVVDRDGGVELDALATLTRDLVEAIDAQSPDADYTLELTTRGVDRPLTLPRHWRRAQGRRVEVDVVGADGTPETIAGRIGASTDATVELIRNQRGRFTTVTVDLDSVTKAIVGVDFTAPNRTELELCGLDAAAIARLTRTD